MTLTTEDLHSIQLEQQTRRQNISLEVASKLVHGEIPTSHDFKIAKDKLNASIEIHRGEVESSSGRKLLADVERLLNTTSQLLDSGSVEQHVRGVVEHLKAASTKLSQSQETNLEQEVKDAEASARGQHQAVQKAKETMQKRKEEFETAFKGMRVFTGLMMRSYDFRNCVTALWDIIADIVVGRDLDHLNTENMDISSALHSKSKGKKKLEEGEGYTVEEPEEQRASGPSSSSSTGGGVSYGSSSMSSTRNEILPEEQVALNILRDSGEGKKVRHTFSRTYSDEQVIDKIVYAMHMISSREDMRKGFHSLLHVMAATWKDLKRAKYSMLNNNSIDSALATTELKTMDDEAIQEARLARSELQQLILQLAGERSPEQFLAAVESVIKRMDSDPDLGQFMHTVKLLLETMTADPDLYQQEKEVMVIRQRVRATFVRLRLFAHKYKNFPSFETALREGGVLLDAIKLNKPLLHIVQDAKAVLKDLVYSDRRDNTKIDIGAISEIKNVIASIIMEQLDYIPLPAMQGYSKNVDWAVDNLVLSAKDIMPDKIHIQTLTDTDLSFYTLTTKPGESVIKIDIEGIYAKLRDVIFAVEKKNWPRKSDRGTVDISCSGNGGHLTLWMKMLKVPGSPPLFTGANATFKLSNLTLTFGPDVQHPRFLKGPTLRRKVRKMLEEKVSEQASLVLTRICGLINVSMYKVSLKAKESMSGSSSSGASTNMTPEQLILGGKGKARVSRELFRNFGKSAESAAPPKKIMSKQLQPSDTSVLSTNAQIPSTSLSSTQQPLSYSAAMARVN